MMHSRICGLAASVALFVMLSPAAPARAAGDGPDALRRVLSPERHPWLGGHAAPGAVTAPASDATSTKAKAIVGTWLITVPGSGEGDPGFQALQTFSDDGTLTETSSLLATLTEGPAHGVWQRDGSTYLVTFELFVFDESHASYGRLRVRNVVTVSGDTLSSQFAVDYIDPSGAEEPNVGGGTFTGTRITARPL